MSVIVRGKKIIYVDNEESLISLIDKGFIKFEGKKYFILNTNSILNSISSLETYKKLAEDYKRMYEKSVESYHNERNRSMELQSKLRILEDKITDNNVNSNDRNGHGRFLPGHKVDQPRDKSGRFIKKDK